MGGEAQGLQRGYSWQGMETRVYDAPQDMPFVDGFPDRLIREGLPGRLKRGDVKTWSHLPEDMPGPRKGMDKLDSKISASLLDLRLSKRVADKEKLSSPSKERSPVLEKDAVSDEELSDLSILLGTPESQVLPVKQQYIEEIPESDQSAIREQDQVLETTKEDGPQLTTDISLSLTEEVSTQEDVATELRLETRSRKIHVLGTSPTGKYIAHALASLPHAPPVTLLCHRPSLIKEWQEEGAGLGVIRGDKINVQAGITVEPAVNFKIRAVKGSSTKHSLGQGLMLGSKERIDNLIVTTDAHATVPALAMIKSRIRSSTTICFMNDGMGVIDELNEKLFPDPQERPNYALGNISHKISPTEFSWTVIEKEVGEVSFTMLERDVQAPREDHLLHVDSTPLVRRMEGKWSAFKHLGRTLSQTPELNVRSLRRSEFYRHHLEKIIANSIIGPLTVMFDCTNDQLLYNHSISNAMKPLLNEIYEIVRMMPEIARNRRSLQFFSPTHLHSIVISKIKKSGRNNSAMLQAVRNGQRTGIQYYNGFFVRRAQEFGLPCAQNQMMVALVQGKQAIVARERESYIPLQKRDDMGT